MTKLQVVALLFANVNCQEGAALLYQETASVTGPQGEPILAEPEIPKGKAVYNPNGAPPPPPPSDLAPVPVAAATPLRGATPKPLISPPPAPISEPIEFDPEVWAMDDIAVPTLYDFDIEPIDWEDMDPSIYYNMTDMWEMGNSSMPIDFNDTMDIVSWDQEQMREEFRDYFGWAIMGETWDTRKPSKCDDSCSDEYQMCCFQVSMQDKKS
jgi:hypothetical protein